MKHSWVMPDPNLQHWLAKHAQRSPDALSMVYWRRGEETERWTYGHMHRMAQGLAAWMFEAGVRPGDRVALLDFNDVRFLVTMFAAASMGAVFVPLNFRLSAPEVVAMVRDCGAALLIHGAEFAPIQAEVARQTNCGLFLRSDRNGGDEFAQACAAAPDARASHRPAGWDETAWLLYTSGSTGRPKGVMLSHGNIFWNTLNTILIQGGLPTDKVLVSAPLFHAAPVSTVMESFLRGATIHLEKSFDPGSIIGRIASERISIIAGVPAMYQFLAEQDDFHRADLSSLRGIIVGGAPVSDALIKRYHDRGIAVIQRYGLTEAAPLVTALAPGAPAAKAMTAGQAPMFGDVRIAAAGIDGIGEIQMRGPNVMLGYWDQPAESAAAFEDGWLRTGDLGRLDGDGFLTVAGRIKEMIVSGGENIYAAEVEARLAENPDVLESAVIGITHPKWGETVCAVISPVPGCGLDERRIMAHLQGRLARYKQPTKIVIVDDLPKNGAGKIDKLTLKRRYGDDSDRRVENA
ncbi:MAG: p-hydroxycinnamoyl-CoA synthetase [Alcaligenaceae bacterium]|nr:p-hydroxycinnamoyl-CoA synthetase [Alcaligenaceae bacterium SAGV5]MPS55104.1 p-hydroxycinnamoyl-CoA synthetase [Alcaligenaceae bacterium SAGV3]MPT59209.1 p-hydroxycinnamoyl-CoA synthetase [Alcaligenaceae bacterium]